jgi:hypothetical protein
MPSHVGVEPKRLSMGLEGRRPHGRDSVRYSHSLVKVAQEEGADGHA